MNSSNKSNSFLHVIEATESEIAEVGSSTDKNTNLIGYIDRSCSKYDNPFSPSSCLDVGKILLKITAVSLVDARSLGKRHFSRLLSRAVVCHEVVGRSVHLYESDAEVKQ